VVQYLNLDLIASSLAWVSIGLLAYWARKSRVPKGRRWVLLYAVLGAPMLVLVAWDFIKAGEASRREVERRRRGGKGGAKVVSASPSVASDSQPRNARARSNGKKQR
jgi:hypothetical protein